jgi:hypothetical protein
MSKCDPPFDCGSERAPNPLQDRLSLLALAYSWYTIISGDMDFLKRLQTWLLTLRASIRRIHDALPNHAASVHGADEGERDEELPPDRVRAVVSFDEETIRTTQAEAERQYTTQNSLKNAAWAAVVAATIYALITVFMWFQMIKQNRIASSALNQSVETFRMDERAWVEIEPIQGTLFSAKTSKFGADFRYPFYLKNVGKTIARDLQFRALRNGFQAPIQFGDDAKQIAFEQDNFLLGKVANTPPDLPLTNPIPKVLAPQATSPIPVMLFGQEPQIFPKIEMVSYLVGRIDYTDAFGVPHWNKFCLFVVNYRGELWHCKEGNDEDKNPETPPKRN